MNSKGEIKMDKVLFPMYKRRRLDSQGIDVWYVNDQEIREPFLLSTYFDLMSEDEKARYQRFYFPHDRHQYLVTRALVRTVLSRYYPEVLPHQWLFGKNHYGKPYVDNIPNGEMLYFNVSHAQGIIVLAITRLGEIGIDVENPKKEIFSLELAKSICSDQELDALKLCINETQKVNYFFLLWRLKEAYFKAKGCGLITVLKNVSFSLSPNGKIDVDFHHNIEFKPELWHFYCITLEAENQAALAIRLSLPDVLFKIQKVTPCLSDY